MARSLGVAGWWTGQVPESPPTMGLHGAHLILMVGGSVARLQTSLLSCPLLG